MWFYWKCKIIRTRKRTKHGQMKCGSHAWRVDSVELERTIGHSRRFTGAMNIAIQWQKQMIKKHRYEHLYDQQ